MTQQFDRADILPSVEADLFYLTPLAGRPRVYTDEPPPGEPRTTIVPEPHRVAIRNMRPIACELSVDRQGFALVVAPTEVRDFYDDEELKAAYYPEAERILAAATGATRVFIFDNTRRRRTPGASDYVKGLPRQPVPRVHVDHTEKSAPQNVRDRLGDEAEELLRGRVQVVNLWRPLRGPLTDMPLAVADARSVAPDDLVPTDLVYPHRVGETYSVRFNPAHRWFYVPAMQKEEALLLKCYDSATDGRARFAPHTAFEDPTTPPDAAPRESIEVRALLFHPPA